MSLILSRLVMMRIAPLCLILSAVGCATTNEPTKPLWEPDKKQVRNPEKTWAFFQESFKARHFKFAHLALSTESKGRLPYEAFYGAFASYDLIRGLVTEGEQHGPSVEVNKKTRKITVCNKAYGFKEEFELRKEFGVLWVLHITPEQQQRLQNHAMAFFEYPYEADGDFYVYPRDRKQPERWARCPHGK